MIYTKTGDGGTTSLVGGARVAKDDSRVEAYGTVDELNSHIGMLAEMLRATGSEHVAELKTVQRNLFTIQTLLATEDASIYERLPQLTAEDILDVERQIDSINDTLPKLKSFVIAGGNSTGAYCHICRTVCRRAERRIITLSHAAPVDGTIMKYINRLSDYLFVLGRQAVVANGDAEDLYTN